MRSPPLLACSPRRFARTGALEFAQLKAIMTWPIVVDLRNVYRPEDLARNGFVYQAAVDPPPYPRRSTSFPTAYPQNSARRCAVALIYSGIPVFPDHRRACRKF